MIFIPKHRNTIELDGSLSIITTNAGIVTNELYIPNRVVNVGKDYIASRMINNTAAIMQYMALGIDDSSSTDVTLNALQSELTLGGYARRQATITQEGSLPVAGGGTAQNQVQYVSVFEAGNPGSDAPLVEAGIFDATTGGNMLCRTTFPIVTKQDGDTITITWTITIN